ARVKSARTGCTAKAQRSQRRDGQTGSVRNMRIAERSPKDRARPRGEAACCLREYSGDAGTVDLSVERQGRDREGVFAAHQDVTPTIRCATRRGQTPAQLRRA